jgi:hypothetical protein
MGESAIDAAALITERTLLATLGCDVCRAANHFLEILCTRSLCFPTIRQVYETKACRLDKKVMELASS